MYLVVKSGGVVCSYMLQVWLSVCILTLFTLSCREPYRHYPETPFDAITAGESLNESDLNSDLDELDISSASWQGPHTRLIRLTQNQFIAKVVWLFGEDARPTSRIPSDLVIEGSKALGASKSIVIERDAELFAKVAEEVAGIIVENNSLLSSFSSCFDPSDESFNEQILDSTERDRHLSCLANMAEAASQHIWGRSLSDQEWSHAYIILAKGVDLLKIPKDSFAFYLSWLLQSPHFLYRFESELELPNGLKVWSSVTLAERLSYFLTNSPPQASLLGADDLHTRSGWEREVDQLLESESLEQGIRAIANDLWSLWRLDQLHLNKDPESFEHLSTQLAAAAKEETLMSFWDASRNDLSIPKLFTQPRSYVDANLAALYQVAAPQREGFGWVDYAPESTRVGLLGQVSFLALNAHPTSTSSTLRGFFVLDKLLCSAPPPPPAGVDTSIPEPTPDRPTLRDRLESHLSEPSCAGCHRGMDMIGLVFEGFDALGGMRRFERDVEIDVSGEFLGVAVSDPRELAEALSQHPKLSTCLSKRLYRYARASYEIETEEVLIKQLAQQVESTRFTFKALLKSIALSEGFHGPYLEQE